MILQYLYHTEINQLLKPACIGHAGWLGFQLTICSHQNCSPPVQHAVCAATVLHPGSTLSL